MTRPTLALVLALGLSGCVPYAVGTTAATVPERAVEPSAVVQVASARRDLDRGESGARPALAVGNEARLGLDARSDVGVRLTGLGGLSMTYKRRLSGQGEAGNAVIVGAGVLTTGHFHLEATALRSFDPVDPEGRVVPYVGLRVQDLTPFGADAVDTPVAVGVFGGARLGWPDLGLTPELGVFYSPGPRGSRSALIVVPSVTVRGDRLRKALGI